MYNKKVYGLVLIVFIVIGIVYWGLKSSPSLEAPLAEKMDGTEQFSIIYYYGAECPYCTELQKFIDENKIAEKVLFTKKEIWHNVENAKDLNVKARECGLDEERIGVPFLYTDGKCYVGAVEVRNIFKKEAGINE